MLVTCKDNEGRVIAYTEYQIVNKFGHPCEVGEYIWINDVFIHKDYEHKHLLKYMLQKELIKYMKNDKPLKVRWMYWFRREKGKPNKTYDLKKLLRRL